MTPQEAAKLYTEVARIPGIRPEHVGDITTALIVARAIDGARAQLDALPTEIREILLRATGQLQDTLSSIDQRFKEKQS